VAFPIPENLAAGGDRPRKRAWLEALPETVSSIRARWSIELDEPFRPGGTAAWVAPARDPSGRDLVLKIGWRHPEAEHEGDGLRFWDGNGAVRLHAREATVDTVALLLERCRPGTVLARLPEPEQDVVIAGLLPRLWVEPPAGHPFASLQTMCHAWADSVEQAHAAEPFELDPGLVREGIDLLRTLPATADRSVLLCTDLHAENVLAAEREPWLVIDPKPHVGDPAYDVVQHLLNCPVRLHADPRRLARELAGLVDVDPDRVERWLFARCVQESGHSGLADVARVLARP
jgi:streptomycin 6-kinase